MKGKEVLRSKEQTQALQLSCGEALSGGVLKSTTNGIEKQSVLCAPFAAMLTFRWQMSLSRLPIVRCCIWEIYAKKKTRHVKRSYHFCDSTTALPLFLREQNTGHMKLCCSWIHSERLIRKVRKNDGLAQEQSTNALLSSQSHTIFPFGCPLLVAADDGLKFWLGLFRSCTLVISVTSKVQTALQWMAQKGNWASKKNAEGGNWNISIPLALCEALVPLFPLLSICNWYFSKGNHIPLYLLEFL